MRNKSKDPLSVAVGHLVVEALRDPDSHRQLNNKRVMIYKLWDLSANNIPIGDWQVTIQRI